MSVAEADVGSSRAEVGLDVLEAARVLSPQQLQAIPLLVVGTPHQEVAHAVKAHPNTVSRWIVSDDDFRTELARQKALRYDQGLQRAYTVIDGQLDSEDTLTAWRAGNTRLQHHAQMARAHGSLTVTHTVLDRVRSTIAALPQEGDEPPALEAEYTTDDTTGSSECTDNE